MEKSGIVRGAVGGAVLLTGLLAATLPAQAESAGPPYGGWGHREDARPPATSSAYSLPDSGLGLYSYDGKVAVVSGSSSAGVELGVQFVPPTGQSLQAGVTYRAAASSTGPTSTAGQLFLWRDDTMCGRTESQLPGLYRTDTPVAGWFRVSEIEYDAGGKVTRFAATYEMNCQYLDGPAGFEGSVAVNASLPLAPIPGVPTTPGPISNLTATNVGPDGGGVNDTTLTWTNPAEYGDVNLDLTYSTNRALFPSLIGTDHTRDHDHLYRGRASRYYDGNVDFMSTRTYRLVPRGPSGRLGRPSLITVLGTRLNIPDTTDTIMIGQEARFSGRLSESWDYVHPDDVMKGPPVPGARVLMCRQSLIDYVDGECDPVDRTTTDAEGHFTLSASPTANSRHNVVVPATSTMVGNAAVVLDVRVAPHTDLRTGTSHSTRVGAQASVRGGSVIRFTTSRARRGSRGFVRLQRLDDGKWRTITRRRLGTGSARLAIRYREYKRGWQSYRVVKPGDARHVNGRSRIVRIRVR